MKKSLRYWFIVHFVIDFIVGIPLLISPSFVLNLLNIQTTETVR